MFVGRGAAALAVHEAIRKAEESGRSVLVSGASGTGKRTIAEVLDHFAGDFAYVPEVEQLSIDEQARIPHQAGRGRLVVGTRLELGSHAAATKLSPKLLRWCATSIRLPSLAERADDLEALAMYFLSHTPTRRPFSGISAAAVHCLQACVWPGNGSELESVLANAVERAAGPVLDVGDLPQTLRGHASSADAEFSLELAQRRAIDKAIRHARGNKRHAARLLGIGKSTLYRKLEEGDEQTS